MTGKFFHENSYITDPQHDVLKQRNKRVSLFAYKGGVQKKRSKPHDRP